MQNLCSWGQHYGYYINGTVDCWLGLGVFKLGVNLIIIGILKTTNHHTILIPILRYVLKICFTKAPMKCLSNRDATSIHRVSNFGDDTPMKLCAEGALQRRHCLINIERLQARQLWLPIACVTILFPCVINTYIAVL